MRNDDEDLEREPEAADEHRSAPSGAVGIMGFAAGLLCGALVGAGVALLVAPQRGTKLRRRLARSLRDAGDDLRDEFGGLRDSARRRIARRRRRLRRSMGHVMS